MIPKTLVRFYGRLPDKIKNRLKYIYYNRIVRPDFYTDYDGTLFHIRYRNGIAFKCVEAMLSDLNQTNSMYTKHCQIKKGDVVVDCRAFVGMFTLYAAGLVGKNGRIIVFEPDPFGYKQLEENLKINNISNVILIKKGIWDSEKIVDFVNLVPGSSSVASSNQGLVNKIFVVPIDEELERLDIDSVDFIKMDIEGAELEAIEGMKKTLSHGPNLAIASYHIRNGEMTHRFVEKKLNKLGYKAWTEKPPDFDKENPHNIITYGKFKR